MAKRNGHRGILGCYHHHHCYDACRYLTWSCIVLQMVLCIRILNGEETKVCEEKMVIFSHNHTSKTDRIRSPGYGTSYPINMRCIYYLIGRDNERVSLRFLDFDVDGVPPRCLHDYVDVYTQVISVDQDLLSAPLQGRFCGKDQPDRIISMTNILVIGFYTDSYKEATGFEMEYTFMDDSMYRVGTPAAPNVCGFTVNSQPRGVIMSPTYPGRYPDNIFCFYKLHGVRGQRVRISFHDFDLYSGGKHCPFDYIKVYDGPTNEAEVIDTFCGTVKENERPPYTLFSRSESLHIEFVTKSGRKNSLTHADVDPIDSKQTGFNATFEISSDFVDLECDRRIRSRGNGQSNGTVTSPYYPRPYPPDVKCHYFIDGLIDAQNLENVQLFIDDVSIGKPKADGRRKDSWWNMLNRKERMTVDEEFCGQLNRTSTELRTPIVTDNPRLVLIFHSAAGEDPPGRGFKAVYQFLTDYAIPGTPVNDRRCHFLYSSSAGNHGVFNSPRHPSNYPPKTDCFYDFRGADDELVRITFENFKIEGEAPK